MTDVQTAVQTAAASVAAPAEPDPQPDVGDLIRKAVALRDLIDAKKEEHTKELVPYNEAFEQLENYLLGVLSDSGLSNMKKKGAGTISILDKVSTPVDDAEAFRAYVIANQRWDLADWKANSRAVQDHLKEANALPPGVRLTTFRKLGLRRPSKTDIE